jgi:hypothetical protein
VQKDKDTVSVGAWGVSYRISERRERGCEDGAETVTDCDKHITA